MVNQKEKKIEDLKKENSKLVDTKDNKEMKELNEKNETLQSELDQMKIMMQQLIDTQTEQNIKNEKVKEESIETILDDYVDIPQHKQITVTSLYYGGMSLYGTNNKKIRFDKFGVSRPISYGDLTDVCVNHRGLAEEGAFFIHDKNAVKNLYLEENYKTILDVKKIDNLITLSDEKIDEVMSVMSEIQKDTMTNVVIKGIMDGDHKYTNWSKVNIISKHVKRDLQNIANERMKK